MPILGDYILPYLTLISDIFIVLVVLDFILFKFKIKSEMWKGWNVFGKNAMLLAFLVSLGAMLLSLYYSDYLGYEPCKLCWYQRIFIYPQVFMFALALWKRRSDVWKYSLILSIIGFAIAADQYLLQSTNVSVLPCPVTGYSASCSEIFILKFGYLTIPMMSLTAFALLILLCFLAMKHKRE